VRLKSRRQRRTIENLKKFGIWIFLVLFVASIAGVVLITSIGTAR